MQGKALFSGRFDMAIYESMAAMLGGSKPRAEWSFNNGTTDEGITDNLDKYFRVATPATPTWFMMLIKNASPVLSPADTLASHAWTEVANTTEYTGTRPVWTPQAANNKAISNAGTVNFSMLAAITVGGAGLCSVNAGTGGKLWATGAFAAPQNMGIGEVLATRYTCTGSAT